METAVSTEGARPIGVVATERPEGEIDRLCPATVSQCLAAPAASAGRHSRCRRRAAGHYRLGELLAGGRAESGPHDRHGSVAVGTA